MCAKFIGKKHAVGLSSIFFFLVQSCTVLFDTEKKMERGGHLALDITGHFPHVENDSNAKMYYLVHAVLV